MSSIITDIVNTEEIMSKLVWFGTLATAVALSLSLPAMADHGQLSGDALQALYPASAHYFVALESLRPA